MTVEHVETCRQTFALGRPIQKENRCSREPWVRNSNVYGSEAQRSVCRLEAGPRSTNQSLFWNLSESSIISSTARRPRDKLTLQCINRRRSQCRYRHSPWFWRYRRSATWALWGRLKVANGSIDFVIVQLLDIPIWLGICQHKTFLLGIGVCYSRSSWFFRRLRDRGLSARCINPLSFCRARAD